jgi:fatty acid desaturase
MELNRSGSPQPGKSDPYKRTTKPTSAERASPEVNTGRVSARLPSGFRPSNPETPGKIKILSRRVTILMLMLALFYWANIVGAALAAEFVGHRFSLLPTAVVYVSSIIWIARSMRALECMTHEFAHDRRGETLANLLVSLPLASTVAAMRHGHNTPHHVLLGIRGVDPDLRRYDALHAHDLDRSGLLAFVRDVLMRLPRYVGGWFMAMNTGWTTVLAAICWHLGIICVPLWYFFYEDPAVALWKWTMYWAVPYIVVLPIIRFVGETGKHVYNGQSTVMDVTVSNVGLIHKVLFHPFGDGHHTLHHLRPAVPGYNLGRLHRWLLRNEPEYRKGLRFRLKVLEQPRRHTVAG